MNIVIPFHAGDKEQVARLLGWIEELGGIGKHKLFLMPAMGQRADFSTSLPFSLIEDSYGLKSDWSASNAQIRNASAPNSMLRQAAWHFYLKKLGYWMFLEPDAIPVREGWIDSWDEEYRRERKYFMGALVSGVGGQYPDHLTGIAIYPQDSITCRSLMLPTMATVEGHTQQVELAFDIAAANEILGGSVHLTKQIQHVFRGPEFETMADLQRINPETTIFHTDKRGGLIKLLRAKRQGGETANTLAGPAIAGSNPAPAAKLKVHTYFRPCVDSDALAEQKRILAIWEKNWSDAGWEPVIITEAHARKHPDFEKYQKAFAAMPTVSPKEYEMACWLRWVAMAEIGGLMVDYDVLSNGFHSSADAVTIFPIILSDNNPVPCAVVGEKIQYQNAIDAFLICKPAKEQGKPHLSDQICVQQLKFPAAGICKEVGTFGWGLAKLIHFSHAASGKKRSDVMKAWVDDSPKIDVISPDLKSAEPLTVADHIAALVEFSKKDGFAKGRIIQQMRKAGLLPKK